MSYESKVFITETYECNNYHRIVASMDLCCMGYDRGWRELFNKPFEGEVYIENGNVPTTEDRYGAKLKWATIREVYDWCIRHKIDDGRTYWRQEMLEALLRSMIFELGNGVEHFKVIHYGY